MHFGIRGDFKKWRPWDNVVPARLRQQGPTIDITRGGADFQPSDNHSTAAPKGQRSTGIPSAPVNDNLRQPASKPLTSVTHKVKNGSLNAHTFDRNCERQVPEVVPSAPRHAPNQVGQTSQVPPNYNTIPPFMPNMYSYPFGMPFEANTNQTLHNPSIPGQMHAMFQQVPHPLFMQSSLQTPFGGSNNTTSANNGNVGSDGVRPLNFTSEKENNGGQSSHRDLSSTSNSRPDNNRQQSTTEESGDVFIGAYKKRYIKYFVSNIDERSTRSGILTHFKDNGVVISDLSLHRSKNGNCYAKVTVERKYKEAIESNDFDWPDGVYCNYWKANTNNRRSRQTERQNKK